MERKTVPPPATGEEPTRLALVTAEGDVRSSRPHALARALSAGGRRIASISALVLLDLCGLTLGLYTALVLRSVYYDANQPLWGALWRAESDWLPFVALIMVLVFAQAGLYRHREKRERMGRVFASLVLVAVLVLAFGVGVGNEFKTFGLAPTAVITTTIFVALLRGSYEIVSGELLRRAGVQRRAVLVGPAAEVAGLREKLGDQRSGIEYDFVGVVSEDRDVPDRLGGYADMAAIVAGDVDEVIVTGDVRDQQLLEMVEAAHRAGVQVR
ncbi:MAG TPA: hypothetical protein VFU10_00375, partial [Gaiellaceae bacterium]|nr:hypothetical protein [Gaiellaceae bacterium]